MATLARLKKELHQLATDPGPGISAWPIDNNIKNIEAQILGPDESPFAGGIFNLSIQIPDRYPFEPPRVRFITPIYHPNIDSDGRICLDTLKMQPQGSWSPSVNINTLLLTIRMLMENPNADDGLVLEITEEYKRDIQLWKRKALEHTKVNARENSSISNSCTSAKFEQSGHIDVLKDPSCATGFVSVDTHGEKHSKKSLDDSESQSDDENDDDDDDDDDNHSDASDESDTDDDRDDIEEGDIKSLVATTNEVSGGKRNSMPDERESEKKRHRSEATET